MHDQTGHQAESIWIKLARRFGIYIGLFVAGALIAFAYSYIPLHNAKNWKIDYLTERLEAKGQQLVQAETKLSVAEADVSGRPDSETYRMLQDELNTADKTIKDLERRLTKSKKRVSDLENSRSHWKKKFAAAESAAAAAAAAPASPPASPASADSAGTDHSQDGVAEGVGVEFQPDLTGGEDTQGHQ